MAKPPRPAPQEQRYREPRRRQLASPTPGLPRLDSREREGGEGAGLDRGEVAPTVTRLYELGARGTRVPLEWSALHLANAAYWATHARDGEMLPKIKSAFILDKVLGSDHCPVSIEI